jgi:hypothetical protein
MGPIPALLDHSKQLFLTPLHPIVQTRFKISSGLEMRSGFRYHVHFVPDGCGFGCIFPPVD